MKIITWALSERRRAWRLRGWVAALAGMFVALGASAAPAQTIGVPDVTGDQLLFLYDARTDRVTFLSVANPSDDAVFLDVALYSQDLLTELAGATVSLAGAGNLVIDPTSFGGGGANGAAGLAVVTPVVSLEDPTPVVPSEPIVGGFTLANLSLAAGFGQNPFARFAVDDAGEPVDPGTEVDGVDVVYERFDPGILMVPVYFNPADLAPPSQDGNRILLAAFADQYDGGFDVDPVATAAQATFFDAAGSRIAEGSVPWSGILLSDLQSMAGGTSLDGSSGKAFFQISSEGGNVFGLFSQSLGTFAAGQRMPAVASVPQGAGPPTAVTLSFDARVNGEAFACDRTFENIGSSNATVEPIDARLYIQDVRLVNEDGAEVAVKLDQDGTWQYQDVALLDFEDATGLCAQRGTAPTNPSIRGQVPGDAYTRLRFAMGVPESLNHIDSATAPPPLDKTALFWSWNDGYKFIRYDNQAVSNQNEFRIHIGSTNCEGDGRGNATCGNSNRIQVDLPFDPSTNTVVIELASFFVGIDVEQNTPETAPGCMSGSGDPECVGVFAQAGLPYDGAPGGPQQIFSVE